MSERRPIKRAIAGTVALLCAGLVLLLGPAVAAAATGTEDEGFTGAFEIRASHGYRILGIAFRRPGAKQGELSLLVGRRRGAGAIYFTPATVTSSEVKADLGALGEVDLRLVLSGKKQTAHTRCGKPQSVRYEPGYFEGRFEFHGEEEFTSVSASRIPLLVQPLLDLGCGVSSVGETWGPGLPGARLTVMAGDQGDRVTAQFNKNGVRKPVSFEASLDEVRGDLRIHRSVEGRLGAAAFRFDTDLGGARVRPPAPFSGSAAFSREAAPANRWRGSLAVDFPGRSNVRLAAPGARAVLVHALRTQETLHFDRLRPFASLLESPSWPSTRP